jgi:hypothetical protein
VRDQVHAAGNLFDFLAEPAALTTNTAASWSAHPFDGRSNEACTWTEGTGGWQAAAPANGTDGKEVVCRISVTVVHW